MPWVKLIHGLDQQQFPDRSKEKFQVPDFMVIVETSALTHQPLLVEVKRVPREKETLKLQDSQVTLCQQYATTLNIPLVYAVYWDKLSAWTMNSVDSFETKSSSRKLPMLKAFDLDAAQSSGTFPTSCRLRSFAPPASPSETLRPTASSTISTAGCSQTW